jgi:hypothetical protein
MSQSDLTSLIQPTEFCEDCRRITAKDGPLFRSSETRLETELGIIHFKASINALHDSAKHGCITCSFFYEVLKSIEYETESLETDIQIDSSSNVMELFIYKKSSSGKDYENTAQGHKLQIGMTSVPLHLLFLAEFDLLTTGAIPNKLVNEKSLIVRSYRCFEKFWNQ